jgi:multiple sugar transport system ATP-binding protein
MTLGDRVVVMKDGWIQQAGTPLEIYNQPANRFVASFIGAPAMNFIEVELVDDKGDLRANAKDFSIRVPAAKASMLQKQQAKSVTLGVRPENIHLGAPSEDVGTAFAGEVAVTEQLGAELVVGVKSAGATIMASRIAPDTALVVHEKVSMWMDPKSLHFFDAKTEAALR